MAANAHFPKCAKLLKPAEYKHVFNTANRMSDRHLTIFFSANDQNLARLGLAISKKVSKLAVERNRIKRLARETFRLNRQQLQFADFVVLARPSAAKTDNQILIDSFNKLWKKLQQAQFAQPEPKKDNEKAPKSVNTKRANQ